MEETIEVLRQDWDKLQAQLAINNGTPGNRELYARAIMEIIEHPVLLLDKELKLLSANDNFYIKFDTTPGTVMGHYFFDLKKCSWQQPGLEIKLLELKKHETPFSNFEGICNHTMLGKMVFKIDGYSKKISNEQSVFVLNFRDQPDLVEKNGLKKNDRLHEERIKLAIESADIGTWEMDPHSGEIKCDKKCLELLGSKENISTYQQFLNTLYPADRGRADAAIQKAIKGAFNDKYIIIDFRTRFEQVEELKWLKASGRGYFDKNGKAIHFAGTVIEITEQKLNEQLLKESEERFRLAADSAAAMIWLSGRDQLFYYFNKSWLQFTGKTFEDQKGRAWLENIHPDDLDRWTTIFTTSFETRKEFYMEYRLRRFDQEYRWISDSGMPRFSPEGIFEGYIGTCIDIHQQKMTQAELEKLVADRTRLLSDAINNLEASNDNLEEFAYAASHDLQEPLRKIQTFAHRLEEKNGEQLSPDTKLYLSRITQASGRMSRLIGDLLNYSRLQKISEPFEMVDLNAILENELSDFDMIVQEKKATLNIGRLPSVRAIPMRMKQLFHNMISNALKFAGASTPPVLSVYAELLADNIRNKYPQLKKDRVYTMITFADNGIGFNEEFAEKIFNIFQRLNGVTEYEGTGIGLAICKKIVTSHQGVIFAESRENEGALFRIILPVQ